MISENLIWWQEGTGLTIQMIYNFDGGKDCPLKVLLYFRRKRQSKNKSSPVQHYYRLLWSAWFLQRGTSYRFPCVWTSRSWKPREYELLQPCMPLPLDLHLYILLYQCIMQDWRFWILFNVQMNLEHLCISPICLCCSKLLTVDNTSLLFINLFIYNPIYWLVIKWLQYFVFGIMDVVFSLTEAGHRFCLPWGISWSLWAPMQEHLFDWLRYSALEVIITPCINECNVSL